MANEIRVTWEGGFARKFGHDENGAHYIEFEVDELAEQEPGTCEICGKTLYGGVMCQDGGEEFCDSHIDWV